jgi:hypothetical protein
LKEIIVADSTCLIGLERISHHPPVQPLKKRLPRKSSNCIKKMAACFAAILFY